MKQVSFPIGFDPHTHQREGGLMKTVLPYTLKHFPDFLAMPNLEERPIYTGDDARWYKEQLLEVAASVNLPCRPLVSIKYDPAITTPELIFKAKEMGVPSIKFYPDGVTTNSAGGVRDFYSTFPILEAAQACGMIVQWHGEHPDSEIMEREIDFLKFFERAVTSFPHLKQTMEHLSTAQAVYLIKEIGSHNIGATITAHHLYWTLTDMAGGLFKVHLMCKPILKNKRDRDALLEAAMGDDPYFFFGSDSAPHVIGKKHASDVCSGVFTAPYALSLLAEVFDGAGAFDHRLGEFVSLRGRRFYGLPIPTEQTTIREEAWKGPESFGSGEYIIGNAAKDIEFRFKVVE